MKCGNLILSETGFWSGFIRGREFYTKFVGNAKAFWVQGGVLAPIQVA